MQGTGEFKVQAYESIRSMHALQIVEWIRLNSIRLLPRSPVISCATRPNREAMRLSRKYLDSLAKLPRYRFGFPAMPIERIIQRFSKRAWGFMIVRSHSKRTNYDSRSVELEQSSTVALLNTGNSPATTLKYYTKPPGVVMRGFVEGKPVIPGEKA